MCLMSVVALARSVTRHFDEVEESDKLRVETFFGNSQSAAARQHCGEDLKRITKYVSNVFKVVT